MGLELGILSAAFMRAIYFPIAWYPTFLENSCLTDINIYICCLSCSYADVFSVFLQLDVFIIWFYFRYTVCKLVLFLFRFTVKCAPGGLIIQAFLAQPSRVTSISLELR